ncbi:hypothetical protein ACFLTZ_06015 [Chloroflexota bacterium]
MRKLYVIPIIHTSADLGTAAGAIEKRGRTKLGENIWQSHQRTIDGFWLSIADFLNSLPAAGFKLYQDGLIADGEMGMKIVEQGVKDGSKNYEIIAQLLGKGAELIKTEDFSLVKKEYDFISKVIKSKSMVERIAASLKYKLAAKKLLRDRDNFIAGRIAQTLGDEETGILLIGVYHDVVSLLPVDIDVKEVKETRIVKEYHLSLTNVRLDRRRFEQLSKYLTSPIIQNSLM